MDELIQQVAQRAGISPEQAQKAVDAILEQLKERLPEPIASQIQGLLEGNGSPGDLLKGLPGGLGGLFNR